VALVPAMEWLVARMRAFRLQVRDKVRDGGELEEGFLPAALAEGGGIRETSAVALARVLVHSGLLCLHAPLPAAGAAAAVVPGVKKQKGGGDKKKKKKRKLQEAGGAGAEEEGGGVGEGEEPGASDADAAPVAKKKSKKKNKKKEHAETGE
jgi:hypothetical protein